MAIDGFHNQVIACDDPAYNWMNITPSPADLAYQPRALDCTTAGTVDIVSRDGNRVTIVLTPGYPYPVRPVVVDAPTSGTVAQGVVALF